MATTLLNNPPRLRIAAKPVLALESFRKTSSHVRGFRWSGLSVICKIQSNNDSKKRMAQQFLIAERLGASWQGHVDARTRVYSNWLDCKLGEYRGESGKSAREAGSLQCKPKRERNMMDGPLSQVKKDTSLKYKSDIGVGEIDPITNRRVTINTSSPHQNMANVRRSIPVPVKTFRPDELRPRTLESHVKSAVEDISGREQTAKHNAESRHPHQSKSLPKDQSTKIFQKPKDLKPDSELERLRASHIRARLSGMDPDVSSVRSGQSSAFDNDNPPAKVKATSMDEAMASSSKAASMHRIQPSLDRQYNSNDSAECERSQPSSARLKNPGSPPKRVPNTTNHETSTETDETLLHDIRRIYEQRYGVIDCSHRQQGDTKESIPKPEEVRGSVSQAQATSTQPSVLGNAENPTVYRVLVYDPIMQTVNSATTTSIAHDDPKSLSPAEVLLRLSNAGRFLPYFETLQHEGYEIVSGAGDILIFRKVRDVSPSVVSAAQIPISIPLHQSVGEVSTARRSLNPIDGTIPCSHHVPVVTGNYASPTGFVNHNVPVADRDGSLAKSRTMFRTQPAAGKSSDYLSSTSAAVSHRDSVDGMRKRSSRGWKSVAITFAFASMATGMIHWLISNF